MIYLDNAATSYPKPFVVRQAVLKALTEWGGNPGRSSHRLSLAAADAVYRARCRVAEHLGVGDETHIIFTTNATHAINTILHARVKNGDHILISDLEHNAVFRPVWRLAQDGIATYSVFSHRGDIVANLQAQLRENTSILICSHVSNVSGFAFPIDQIAKWCKEKGIYAILDASQGAGHFRYHLADGGWDALCAPGHKGLFGIQGCGIMYIRNEEGLRDVCQGGSGSDSASPEMPAYLPDRFEAGTLPVPSIVSLDAGIQWIESQGLEDIVRQIDTFTGKLHEILHQIPGVSLFSGESGTITALRITGMDSEAFAAELDRAGICVRGGLHCAPLAHRSLGTLDTGLVRISASALTKPREAHRVGEAIAKIARQNRESQ